MDDFAAIYINVTANDGGEYLMAPLRVLMDHGWRPDLNIFSYMTFHGFPKDDSDIKREKVEPKDYDAFWNAVIQLERDKTDIIELFLFWKDTKQYINIDFRPEGMMAIALHGRFAPIEEEIDLVEQELVKPLQEASEIEFLKWDCYWKDDKDTESTLDEVYDESTSTFTRFIELQSLSVKVPDIDLELLNHLKEDGEAELMQEHKDTCISLYRTGQYIGIGASIPTEDSSEKLEHIREMAKCLIEDIPGSSKVADGPHVRFGTHGVEIELCNPPMEKVLAYIHDLLNLVYKIESDEELLFLYS